MRPASDAGWLVSAERPKRGWPVQLPGRAAAVFVAAPGGGRVAASARIWCCDEGAAPDAGAAAEPIGKTGPLPGR